MRRLLAALVVGTLLIGLVTSPAHAGGAAYDLALALGAFALFTNLVLAPLLARPVYAAPPPVVYPNPPAVHAAAPSAPGVTSGPPPRATGEVVLTPHGRYVLLGDGASVPHHWMWVPAPPAGAPPPPPPR
jgi:hypothetical protein